MSSLPPASGPSTYEVKTPTGPIPPNVSILTAGTASEEVPHNGYNAHLMAHIGQGKSLGQSHEALSEKPLKTPLRVQHPQQFGAAVPDTVANPGQPQKGTALLVSGQRVEPSDEAAFSKDIDNLETMYKGMGYDVKVVDQYPQFLDELEAAKKQGDGTPNDNLIVHFTGHGHVVKEANQVKSVTRPAGPESAQTGAFSFKSPSNTDNKPGLEHGDIISEPGIMGPIGKAAPGFNHVTCIFDTCHSGSFNTQYLGSPVDFEAQTDDHKVNPEQLKRVFSH